MTTATYNAAHVAEALDRLMQQYRSKPKFEAVLSAVTRQWQAAEDGLKGVQDGRGIYDAIGAQLDVLGKIVVLDRPAGVDDDVYRILLLAKIGQNTSGGDAESIIDVFKVITNASFVRLDEYFPAALSLYSDGVVADDLRSLVATVMKACVAGGVSADFLLTGDPDIPFSFAGSLSNSAGFGDLNDPTVGGKFASLII
jgi:hypothetical protein